MQLARRLTSALFRVVSLVVVLYLVSLLGIRLAGFEIGIVMSDSMQPALSRGDLVILQDPSTKEVMVTTKEGELDEEDDFNLVFWTHLSKITKYSVLYPKN